ncbi:stage III sporulation protein AF [Aliibacillus thermotolerans]|uniref:Stage III sporulation protein AF n=1 Tax=Aliibacillus thermotolerans TaxID=1834418 RepID=A0ABW0U7W4_9BACI|nr:stage III sporulation protein AF [Aliibacillus thermotolerans]MDA3131132.1 stage III sporulation protein AF [Aliibacillus thermotolerans]
MEWLGEWMSQLIIFLIAAFLIEILLPSSSFRTYVRLVLSFILMLLIIEPILSFMNVPNQLEKEGIALFSYLPVSMEEEINAHKTEIEAGQDAYISNQVAKQMQAQVEETIVSRWGWEIEDIQVTYDEEEIEDVKEWVITLSLTEIADDHITQPIRVELAEENDSERENQKREIIKYLEKEWQVDSTQLQITMGGGDHRGRRG